ncbi:MAG: hypothetical protein L0219_10785 [Phycisphaerales bacterium]|nr:hypothetical protein [Phycisphaerales bacterium]
MDWKQVIQCWQALPAEEQARMRRNRIPMSVAESMAFEGSGGTGGAASGTLAPRRAVLAV